MYAPISSYQAVIREASLPGMGSEDAYKFSPWPPGEASWAKAHFEAWAAAEAAAVASQERAAVPCAARRALWVARMVAWSYKGGWGEGDRVREKGERRRARGGGRERKAAGTGGCVRARV